MPTVSSPRPSPSATGHVSRLQPYTSPSEAPRLAICTEGLEGSGKSHFALSAPKPLAYFILDRGFETGNKKVEEALNLSGVDQAFYTFDKADAGSNDPTVIAKAAAEQSWKPLKADLEDALRSQRYRTIVIDSMSEAWEGIRLARFGATEGIIPVQYTPVNNEFRGALIRGPLKMPVNIIWVHKQADEYENKVVQTSKGMKEVGVKTGRLTRKGFKDFAYAAPIMLTHRRDLTKMMGEGRYSIEVTKCAPNPEVEGLVLPEFTFSDFAGMVYPEVDASYWV